MTTKPKITEKMLEKVILQWLNLQSDIKAVGIGGGQFKTVSGGMFKSTSCNGVADIICCLNGLFVCFEVKIGKNKQSPNQIIFENDIKKSGGLYYTVYSLGTVKEIVESLR